MLMQNPFRLFLGLALLTPAFAQRDIGEIVVQADVSTIPLTISSAAPELQIIDMTGPS